jgi:hypothetical protein
MKVNEGYGYCGPGEQLRYSGYGIGRDCFATAVSGDDVGKSAIVMPLAPVIVRGQGERRTVPRVDSAKHPRGYSRSLRSVFRAQAGNLASLRTSAHTLLAIKRKGREAKQSS